MDWFGDSKQLTLFPLPDTKPDLADLVTLLRHLEKLWRGVHLLRSFYEDHSGLATVTRIAWDDCFYEFSRLVRILKKLCPGRKCNRKVCRGVCGATKDFVKINVCRYITEDDEIRRVGIPEYFKSSQYDRIRLLRDIERQLRQYDLVLAQIGRPGPKLSLLHEAVRKCSAEEVATVKDRCAEMITKLGNPVCTDCPIIVECVYPKSPDKKKST